MKRFREARFRISCSYKQLRSHLTNTPVTLAVPVPTMTCTANRSLPRTFTPFITAPVRQGVKIVSAHPKPVPQIVPCIQQSRSPLDQLVITISCVYKNHTLLSFKTRGAAVLFWMWYTLYSPPFSTWMWWFFSYKKQILSCWYNQTIV